MPSRTDILRLLADREFHSGPELGRALGLSRGAIHNAVHRLADDGLEIFSVRGRGYRLATPVEVLDAERVRAALPPGVRECLRELHVHATVDSTNSVLLRRGRAAAPAACLAEWQSAGRGRRGRSWQASPWRNLMLSVSGELGAGPGQAGGLSLAAGVAVARALEGAGVTGVRLKWPNDILWRQRKLGGVLVDLQGVIGDPCLVVVGVGLNIDLGEREPRFIDQPWVDLREIEENTPGRNRLAAGLVAELVKALDVFAQRGFPAFREAWLRRHAMQDEEVVVSGGETGARPLSGRAAGVDDGGALLLDGMDGRRHRVLSGELSLRRA